MSISVPASLRGVVIRKSSGWRLVVAPSPVCQLGVAFATGLLFSIFILGLFAVVIVLFGVMLGASFQVVGIVLAVMVALAGLVVGVLMAMTTAATLVRWVEFRSDGALTQVVIARTGRALVIDIADLRRIVVDDQRRLGRHIRTQVVFHAAGDPVVCEPGLGSPLQRVDPQVVAEWLTGLLAQTQAVVVEHHVSVERLNAPVPEWWTAGQVAAVWQVPIQVVPEVAARWDVRTENFLPRIGAMYQPGRSVLLFDPDGVHEVAEQVRAEGPASAEPVGEAEV